MTRLLHPRPALILGAVIATASSLAFTAGAQADAAPTIDPTAAAGVRTFMVSPSGTDDGPGTTTRPWRTLRRAAAARYLPGDTLLIKRGGTYQGGLTLTSSGTAAAPITVASTGAGASPVIRNGNCIRLVGDYIRVRGMIVRNCSWAGVSVEGANDIVSYNKITGNVVGVHVTERARNAQVRANQIIDNKRLSPNTPGSDDDSGANGVLVQGNGTRVTGNRISGQFTPSPDYGIDGSAIEVYGARNTVIASNSALNNSTFVELGERTTRSTRIARNTVTSTVGNGYFVVTRGAQDSSFGPVLGTTVDHNSVAMNGQNDGGLICFAGCSPAVLKASNNVIVARTKPTWSDGAGMGGGNNMLVDDSNRSSAKPMFVNRYRDLRLVSASPAVDAAGSCTSRTIANRPHAALGWSSWLCRDGNADGRAGVDIGALER